MSAREAILGRVRGALGRSAAAPIEAPPPVRLSVPDVPVEQRIEWFATALEKLNGRCHVAASMEDARGFVEALTAGKRVVTTRSDLLRACGLEQAMPPEQHRDACAGADIGITSAEYALSDTGTLVVFASEEARLASLLPPVHIAVIRRERMLTGLDELLATVPLPAGQSSSMVLITGPSRTADIEQILVRGVHGPGELYVVIV